MIYLVIWGLQNYVADDLEIFGAINSIETTKKEEIFKKKRTSQKQKI